MAAGRVRTGEGAARLVKDELIPALDAMGRWRTGAAKRRAERRELKLREELRIRELKTREG